MKPQDNPPSDLSPGDEIDLILMARTLWNGRKILIGCLIGFTLFGLFYALFSPVEYTARTVMVPQIQSKTSSIGGLGSLAAMAGFNLDAIQGGSTELSPLVYPQIVKSLPFQRALMHTPLNWKSSAQPVSLLYYYDSIYKPNPLELLKKYTLGLPGVVIKWLKGSADKASVTTAGNGVMISLTRQEKDMQKLLQRRLALEVNAKGGYVAFTAIAPEATAAAELAQKAQELLKERITEFKLDKASQNLAFVQSLFNDKKTEFLNVQTRLAKFRDSNLNLGSAMARAEEERLQSEYQLTLSVYSEVAKQFENAKIKVKEDTPVFSVIEPVSIPADKSKPKKSVILVIWFFMGIVAGVAWVLSREYMKAVRKRWSEVK